MSEKSSILRHPLFLTLLGITVSSVLIPILSAKYNEHIQFQTNKLELTTLILEKSTQDRVNINHLITTLGTFEKYSNLLPDDELSFEKRKKRQEIEEIYSVINKSLWFWWMEIVEMNKNYGFENTEILKSKFVEYKNNYIEVITAFSKCRDSQLIAKSQEKVIKTDKLLKLFTVKSNANNKIIRNINKIILGNKP